MKLQYIFSIVFFIFACSPDTEQEIRKLDFKELRERINKGEVNLFQLTYKDSLGNKLTKELRTKLNKGKMFRDFYVDKNNEITEIRLKGYSHEHVFEEIQIRELLNQPLKGQWFGTKTYGKIK
jgi:ribosomal protein L29